MNKDFFISGTGNKKSVNTLAKAFPEFKNAYLCNAACDAEVVGRVEISYDDVNRCPGVYIWELESYVNIPVPEKYGEDFAKYYNTAKGKEMLKKVFTFFTEDKELTAIDQLKKDAYFRLHNQNKVRVYKGWCRVNKAYHFVDFDDALGAGHYRKRGTMVEINFEF